MLHPTEQLAVFLLIFIPLVQSTPLRPPSLHECSQFAEEGACDANSKYMRLYCQPSCDEHRRKTRQALLQRAAGGGVEESEIDAIGMDDDEEDPSFFGLKAEDIDGEIIDFEAFRGIVTIVVNVASYCGKTDSHYRGLVELYNDLSPTGKIEILAFPSNQFGEQEPDECSVIKKFAIERGVEFTMMEKIDVNGPDTHPVYEYLKNEAGPDEILWNFATYYVISPEGEIHSFSGVRPGELKEIALSMMGEEL